MSNFPAGSKVIVTTPWAGETAYKNGDIFTVDAPEGPGAYVKISGEKVYIASDEFEAYTEPKFKVGDKVVVQANPEWGTEGQTGVIESVDEEATATLPYEVKWDNDKYNLWMREQDLELVKEFTFTDIQKGDTIRAEYTQNGVKHTREGTVATTSWNDEQWFSAEGDYVADSFWKGATYTLLERPEPPKPNPFAEAKVGSIATSNEGKRYIWVKESEQGWRAYSVGGDYRSSHPTSDEALRADSTMKITYSAS